MEKIVMENIAYRKFLIFSYMSLGPKAKDYFLIFFSNFINS